MKNMQGNHLKLYIVIETIVVSLLCLLFHFTFEWLGENKAFAPFLNVNESVWEHLKLPTNSFILFAIASFFYAKRYDSYIFVLALKIIFCIIYIPLCYYLLKLVNIENATANIIILYSSIIIAELYEYYILSRNLFGKQYNLYGIIIILIVELLFVIFTYNPIKLDIFKDKRYNSYGIIEKKEE